MATASRSRLIVRRLPSADGGTADGPGVEVGEFILDGRDVAIGRAPSCDIVLEGDQLASRRHALLRSRNDGYTVVDLGSSNGTYINDLEIREAVLLHDGDRISIGGHELIYSTAPASPHASLAGVKLTDQAAAPMTETDPNAVAVIAETAEAPAVAAAAIPAASEAPAQLDDSAAVSVTPDELAASAANDEAVALDDAAPIAEVVAVEEEAPQVFEAPEAPEVYEAPAAATEDVPDFAASGLTDADFEALRQQLAQVSDALARKASAESRVIGQLRGALESARNRLAALAESADTPASPSNDVSNLVAIARQAAENPRHLDYLTALAEHAGEIADALEAGQSSSGVAPSDLEAIRARLDEALG